MNRRAICVVVIAGVLVAGGLADRAGHPRVRTIAAATAVAPEVAPADAVDSTWYCAGGTAKPGGAADASVIVANPTSRVVTGTMTVVGTDGAPPKAAPISVDAKTVAVYPYQVLVQSPYAAAVVALDGGGGVAVEHSVSGPLGADVAPCSTRGSTHWYFADGATTKDASAIYSLFNPFPEDAIVDISFSTEDGRLNPEGAQALVVPKNGVVALDVGGQVIRRRAISASIVARRGRIVADRIQTYDGTAGRKGLALVSGATAPSPTWFFPNGITAPALTERYQLYNPGNDDAVVDFDVSLDKGSVEPIEVTVPAQGRYTELMNAETRLPLGVGHSVAVRSANGVPVVAERSLDGSKPAALLGLASTLGAPAAAKTWVFPAGLATPKVTELLALFNPGAHPATVTVSSFVSGHPVPISRLERIAIPAGRRFVVDMREAVLIAPSLPLVVTSDVPIVAERDLARNKAVGLSMVIGVRGDR